MVTSNDLNASVERHAIKAYVNKLEATTPRTYDIETPIKSFSPKQLADGQGIPDGLITDKISGEKSWIEVTIFARSQKEVERIFKMAKNPQAYQDKIIIIDTDPQQDVHINFLLALQKKIIKDYAPFAQLSNSSAGTLIIPFIDDSPFFDREQCDELLSKIKDEKILSSWAIGQACFETVVFMCRLNDNSLIIETIVDKAAMARFRERDARRKQLWDDINKRKEASV